MKNWKQNFSVDEWISEVTRPLDEWLKFLNKTPGVTSNHWGRRVKPPVCEATQNPEVSKYHSGPVVCSQNGRANKHSCISVDIKRTVLISIASL